MEHLAEKFDLFIFDWDGSIIRLYTHVRLYGRLISAFVKHRKAPKRYDKHFEPPEELEAEENYLASRFLSFFVEKLSKPHLNDYAKELLDELKSRHKRIAIMSNGNRGRILKKIEKAGIAGYFDMVISAKDLHAAKPNPAGIMAVLKALRGKPKRSIYIGDKADDIITAKYAGISSCGIADGFDSYERLKSVGPDYLFRNMREFYRAL
ncbi:MAG: HAD family hydrolase [Candidatus Micrarchaeia archaeon]